MSDRVAVMRQGRIVQLGPPEDLYERPADQFVADFIGESNFLEVTVRGSEGGFATAITDEGLEVRLSAVDAGGDGTRLTLALRPERIRLARGGEPGRPSPAIDDVGGYRRWNGVVEEVVYIGAARKYQVRLGGHLLVAQQQAGHDVPCFGEGETVEIGWSIADLRVVRKH